MRRPWRWALLGALAAVLNANFALEGLLPGPVRIGRRAVSELGVGSAPWSWVFRLGDGSSAAVLLAVAVGMLRLGRRSLAWRSAARLLVAFAATTLVSAVVPLTCPATASSACTGSPPGTPPPWANVVHDDVSIVGTTAGIAAAALLALATRRGQRVGHWLVFVASAGLGVALVVGAQGAVPGWFGWVQRGQILVLSIWFVVVGRSLDAPPGATVATR